ncbi:adhesion G protein-coupled receptor B1-like [Crassostrea virginica]
MNRESARIYQLFKTIQSMQGRIDTCEGGPIHQANGPSSTDDNDRYHGYSSAGEYAREMDNVSPRPHRTCSLDTVERLEQLRCNLWSRNQNRYTNVPRFRLVSRVVLEIDDFSSVDGYLDDWSAWTACSQTCDWGSRTRSRVCNPPRYGGAPCTGTHRELRPCLDIPCPVNGWVGEWSAWSSCSGTCGDGYMAQTRVCHPPLHGGLPCPNRLSKTKLCNLRSCAGKSLHYCIRFTKRIITMSILHNHVYSITGRKVFLNRPSSRHLLPSCRRWNCNCLNKRCRCFNTQPFALTAMCISVTTVDGVLRDWGSWSHCSATCEGYRKRTRACIPPTNGGTPCTGKTVEGEQCGTQHCPVDGVLRNWEPWVQCSATCEGHRTRTRVCISPKNGGAPCSGSTVEGEQCGAQHCPVDGVLRDWGPWGHCSATCEGQRKRTRACIPPTNGGAPCTGSTTESEQCGAQNCPVDGLLSVWGNWTPCSVTCGSGSRVRSRACIPPQHGGRDCHGLTYEMSKCSTSPCTTPPISTTQPPSTTPSGVSCPTCNALMECTWNTVCDVTESCMVRSFPGFQFTTHCIRKDDCSLLKMLAKSQGEIFCCENKACLHTVLGI